MSPSVGPTAEARGLRFRFDPAGDWLFHDLDIEFPARSVSAVTGRSGSGKSTLLNLFGLLLSPNDGQIKIAGRTTETMSDFSRSMLRATHIGFLFQDALLDPTRTVFDNIAEGALFAGLSTRRFRARARDLLREVDLDTDLLSGRLPATISGGQAQRVALCRALIKQPSIVLADEPTGNLDAESSGIVMELLSNAARSGAAVIIATHDDAVIQYADRVVSLD
ncbi:MAG: ABC transporter ATP-binding protein [Acidimicrobiaceae bacterium]|nr:ABC transporter ATP-binding protein [Acidimicrobiaceae bacterium]